MFCIKIVSNNGKSNINYDTFTTKSDAERHLIKEGYTRRSKVAKDVYYNDYLNSQASIIRTV